MTDYSWKELTDFLRHEAMYGLDEVGKQKLHNVLIATDYIMREPELYVAPIQDAVFGFHHPLVTEPYFYGRLSQSDALSGFVRNYQQLRQTLSDSDEGTQWFTNGFLGGLAIDSVLLYAGGNKLLETPWALVIPPILMSVLLGGASTAHEQERDKLLERECVLFEQQYLPHLSTGVAALRKIVF